MPGRPMAGGGRGHSARAGAGRNQAGSDRTVATNRRARHDYAIEETFEAGMVLTGPEVKSLRAGRAALSDAYARVDDSGSAVWVENLHIPPYEMADTRRYEADAGAAEDLLHPGVGQAGAGIGARQAAIREAPSHRGTRAPPGDGAGLRGQGPVGRILIPKVTNEPLVYLSR